MKKLLIGCIVLSMIFSTYYVSAEEVAISNTSMENLFTQAEINKIKEIQIKKEEIGIKKFNGEPFEVPANTDSFYQGKLAQNFLKDGENSINYARFIAGLPPVEMKNEKNEQAQYGPLILDSIKQLNHTPQNPGNIPKDIFSKGYDVTSASNLGKGYSSLFDFNIHCLNDSDDGNIDRVGHRRWLLSPKLKYIGMGYLNGYCATMVFDKSANVQKETIMWPAEGVFPLSMFKNTQAWSVSIPEDSQYEISSNNAKSITVTLTRLSDRKKWSFNQISKSIEKDYFNVDTNNYGYVSAIIFRPDIQEGYKNGDEFSVEIKGMKKELEYKVKFFDDSI